MPFSDAAAWEFLANRIEAGDEVCEETLRHPPGKVGYVMLIRLEPTRPILYVKVQLGAGVVFGRSFHYSER